MTHAAAPAQDEARAALRADMAVEMAAALSAGGGAAARLVERRCGGAAEAAAEAEWAAEAAEVETAQRDNYWELVAQLQPAAGPQPNNVVLVFAANELILRVQMNAVPSNKTV